MHTKTKPTKLHLGREALRTLTTVQLGHVVGGDVPIESRDTLVHEVRRDRPEVRGR